MTTWRNAFGQQVDLVRGRHRVRGARHRRTRSSAPWVERVGPDAGVGPPTTIVAVRQGAVLATAFHPEMTGDRRVHMLFVDIVAGAA